MSVASYFYQLSKQCENNKIVPVTRMTFLSGPIYPASRLLFLDVRSCTNGSSDTSTRTRLLMYCMVLLVDPQLRYSDPGSCFWLVTTELNGSDWLDLNINEHWTLIFKIEIIFSWPLMFIVNFTFLCSSNYWIVDAKMFLMYCRLIGCPIEQIKCNNELEKTEILSVMWFFTLLNSEFESG
jgi:hypothetical protein